MKRLLLSAVAALAVTAAPAHATEWWSPNVHTGECTASMSPAKFVGVAVTNGYPDAHIVEQPSVIGETTVAVTANHTGVLTFFHDLSTCQEFGRDMANYMKKYE